MNVLFFPDSVSMTATIRGVLEQVGWKISYNIYGEFAFIVSWGICLGKQKAPDYRGREILSYLKQRGYWILNENIRKTDKYIVESCHIEAFGYGAALEPSIVQNVSSCAVMPMNC